MRELRHSAHIKAVYDVTIVYGYGNEFLAILSLWQTLSDPELGTKWIFHAHVERDVLEILADIDDGLAQRLEQRWVEEGTMLEDLRVPLFRGHPWHGRASYEERPEKFGTVLPAEMFDRIEHLI